MAINKESIALMRKKRADVFSEFEKLGMKIEKGEDLSPEESDRFDELKKAVDEHDDRISKLEAVQAAAMDASEPVEASMDDEDMEASKRARLGVVKSAPIGKFNIKTSDEIRVPRKSGEALGRLAVANWHKKEFGIDSARAMVEKTWGDAPIAKSLTLTTAQPIIPQDFSSEFVPLMTGKSVVRQFARVLSMPNGTLTIPRQRLGSMGAYMTEGANIATTALSFDNIQMNWKKYGALTYTTREMLSFSPIDAASKITYDLANKLGLLEDSSFLIGNGTNYPVHGILSSINAANIFPSTPTPTFQTVSADLQTAELNLTGNFVDGKFVWVMSPYVVGYLKALSSTFGVYPFKDDLNKPQPMLNGFPVLVSRLLGTNLGTSGANLTNVMLVCGDHCMIGDAYHYALMSTNEGSFLDGSTQVNTFGQDLVAWRMTNAHDFAMEHDVSASVIQATGWSLGVTTAAAMEYDQTADTQGSGASSAQD